MLLQIILNHIQLPTHYLLPLFVRFSLCPHSQSNNTNSSEKKFLHDTNPKWPLKTTIRTIKAAVRIAADPCVAAVEVERVPWAHRRGGCATTLKALSKA
jgi:hypothetical protein